MEPRATLQRLSSMLLLKLVPVSAVIVLMSFAACGWTETPEVSERAAAVPDAYETGDPAPIAEEITTPGPFRFIAMGDFGTGEADQSKVADRLCRWRDRRSFDLVVTTGDNVYPDGAPEDFDRAFFDPYRCLLSDGVKFRASLGNHDIVTGNGRPQLAEPAFGMPARNYVFRRAGVRFVVANSNNLDAAWLATATEPQSGDRWTIVVFHHPVYGAGEHGSTPGLEATVTPIFERNGVDLVLNGHDHNYSVSREFDGVRYIVTGGGGARGYACEPNEDLIRCKNRLHFLEISVSDTRLVVRAVPPKGKPFDRVELAHSTEP